MGYLPIESTSWAFIVNMQTQDQVVMPYTVPLTRAELERVHARLLELAQILAESIEYAKSIEGTTAPRPPDTSDWGILPQSFGADQDAPEDDSR